VQSISKRFLLPVSVLAAAFSACVLYHSYGIQEKHHHEMLRRQAALALEFDLAVRDYLAKEAHPATEGEAAKHESIPGMSSSFMAREVFERLQATYPGYILRFSAANPRNPSRQATPDELRMIEYFEAHPGVDRWQGDVKLDGRDYVASFYPMRMKEACLQCHGQTEDAPAGLVAQYGPTAGLNRALGEVAALNTIAIPLRADHSMILARWAQTSVVPVLGLVLLLGAIFVLFRVVVTRRLALVTTHFKQVATQPEGNPIHAVQVGATKSARWGAASMTSRSD
jgi:hypothetical protein